MLSPLPSLFTLLSPRQAAPAASGPPRQRPRGSGPRGERAPAAAALAGGRNRDTMFPDLGSGGSVTSNHIRSIIALKYLVTSIRSIMVHAHYAAFPFGSVGSYFVRFV